MPPPANCGFRRLDVQYVEAAALLLPPRPPHPTMPRYNLQTTYRLTAAADRKHWRDRSNYCALTKTSARPRCSGHNARAEGAGMANT